MATSSAPTVDDYLGELPPDRRAVMRAVRDVIRRHVPPGYEEGMGYGMICWTIPLARYPSTYNGQPLCYAGLAAQKHHFALYLMDAYQDPQRAAALEGAFRTAGKRLDMGKSCVRFRRLEDLPLEAIGAFVAARPPEEFVARYEASRTGTRSAAREGRSSGSRPAARKSGAARSARDARQRAAARKTAGARTSPRSRRTGAKRKT